MSWLIVLCLGFAGLHFGLLLPSQASIAGSIFLTIGAWVLWKLKWIILGIIGLEELFGGRGDGA